MLLYYKKKNWYPSPQKTPSKSFQSWFWFIFPDSDGRPSASRVSIKYLMCVPRALQRTHQSRHGGEQLCSRGGNFQGIREKAWRKWNRQIRDGAEEFVTVQKWVFWSKLQLFFLCWNRFKCHHSDAKTFLRICERSVSLSTLLTACQQLHSLQAGTYSASAFAPQWSVKASSQFSPLFKLAARFLGCRVVAQESGLAVNGAVISTLKKCDIARNLWASCGGELTCFFAPRVVFEVEVSSVILLNHRPGF